MLIVSAYPVLPPYHGSRCRTAGLAAGLAQAGARVTVLCPWNPGQPVRGRVAGFECHSTFFPSNLLPALLPDHLAPPLALLSYQPLGGPRRRLARFADHDVVQFELCAHARWMDLVPPSASVVYSAHNVERDFWTLERPASAGGYWQRRIERLEERAVARSDLVVTCTAVDADRLAALYGPPRGSAVVPNGIDEAVLGLDRARLRARSRAALDLGTDRRVILFLAGPARHNREALAFLLDQVLPEIDPRAVLLVVGRSGDAFAGRGDGRVRFTGFVPDPSPYLAAADVAVNPVDRGSGSSVKLIHCLAAGLPVVSTKVGIRGFDSPPAGVRVVPRSRFADALSGPLEELRPDREALARFTWRRLGEGLLREYERLRR